MKKFFKILILMMTTASFTYAGWEPIDHKDREEKKSIDKEIQQE